MGGLMVHFVRHGESDRQSRLLTEKGACDVRKTGRELGKELNAVGATTIKVYSSPVVRALQTSDLLVEGVRETAPGIRILNRRVKEFLIGKVWWARKDGFLSAYDCLSIGEAIAERVASLEKGLPYASPEEELQRFKGVIGWIRALSAKLQTDGGDTSSTHLVFTGHADINSLISSIVGTGATIDYAERISFMSDYGVLSLQYKGEVYVVKI